MAEKGFKRKLTAIFSADAVEYSRLMGEDEEATVRTLTAYREVLTTLIQQHNGKVLDSPGDNLLAEFVSVVDAVQCAVAVQKEIKARNNELTENRRMQFRIGINLGDVIQEEERIYGDGVNIAARLEGLAEPGGICISKTAFDHIESKLPYGYDFLGDQTVKNITKPVGAYRVIMEPRVTVAGKPVDKKPAALQRMPILVGAVAVLVLAVAAGIWQFYVRRPSVEPASVEKMAYPLPDKPSIAVLPFTNMSGDPEQEYFCDGMTEDIITALSNAPDIFVIARHSTFTYKGKAVKVQQIAEDLGVRYVLEGSVRKSEDRVRVTAQLIDALTGKHLWAERYDRELKEIFAVQDEITFKIFDELQVELSGVGDIRSCARGTDNINAYLKFLQGTSFLYRETVEDNAISKRKFEEAVALDSDYSSAYAMLGYTYMFDVLLGSSKSPKQSFAMAFELIQKSLALDQSCPAPYVALANFYLITKQHDKAIDASERGVAHNPNHSIAIHTLGKALMYADRVDEGMVLLKRACRLNPKPPYYFQGHLGNSYMLKERYDDALVEMEKAISLVPTHVPIHLTMAACYSALGRIEEARAAVDTAQKINPKFTLSHFSKTYGARYKNPARLEKFVNLLREAGMK